MKESQAQENAQMGEKKKNILAIRSNNIRNPFDSPLSNLWCFQISI